MGNYSVFFNGQIVVREQCLISNHRYLSVVLVYTQFRKGYIQINQKTFTMLQKIYYK